MYGCSVALPRATMATLMRRTEPRRYCANKRSSTNGPCPDRLVQPPEGGTLPVKKQLVSAQESSFQAAQLMLFSFIHSCQSIPSSAHTSFSLTPPSAWVAPHSVTNSGAPSASALFAPSRSQPVCVHE